MFSATFPKQIQGPGLKFSDLSSGFLFDEVPTKPHNILTLEKHSLQTFWTITFSWLSAALARRQLTLHNEWSTFQKRTKVSFDNYDVI